MTFSLFLIKVLILVQFLENNLSKTQGLRLIANTDGQKKSKWTPLTQMPKTIGKSPPAVDSGESLGVPKHMKDRLRCPEEGDFPIANDCKKYLECKKNGPGKTFGTCPEGELFDHLLRKCLPAAEDPLCRDLCRHEGDQYPDPLNAEGYLRCRAGVVRPFKCSPGKEYDGDLKRCVVH